ncbi:glycosyltransferase [Novosphingobium umbonatum]|uniref:Glycosyltransferase n=2 Tax=Novosphingobium umbonatum TaxID=1908524 RepID=A0A3S3TP83_9SPHN|nr:glycosyltransferase [Novosphingobium umbonatum]
MPMDLAQLAAQLAIALAGAGLAYQVLALVALRAFFARPLAGERSAPPLSILKPLYGDEPRLGENLASFLAQDYTGPVQMVCGTNSRSDAAVPVAQALIATHPQHDIALHRGPRLPGANGKMGNLAAMMQMVQHDTLVLSDSDMVVGPDYLSRISAALDQPGVGAVSCLYVGRGDAGFWSKLGAVIISLHTMPNMVVGLSTGMAQPCMGSTIALRRDVLDEIGGFASFTDVLADDHAIGAAVRESGLRVDVPPMLLVHAGAEGSAKALWRQHLRWAVTVRDLAGAGHYGSLITHALPLSLLAALVAPPAGGALLLATLAFRLVLGWRVARLSPVRLPLWLLPAADLFAFAVFCGSLIARNVDWRGEALTIQPHGRIASTEARQATPVARDE